MAAIIVALHRWGRRNNGAAEEELRDKLDQDNDGAITPAELQGRLPHLDVRAEALLSRLTLEEDMADMMCKLPNFFMCVFCFLVALMEFSPPAVVSDIHRHLRTHFQLSGVSGIKDFHSIYGYIETFEAQNKKLQASSTAYWCEDRYAEHIWDRDLLVPHWTCASPRHYALTLTSDSAWSWSSLHSAGSLNLSAGDVDSCADDDAGLQAKEGDAHVTCHGWSHVCEIDLGILYCPKSCGFCGPFEYRNHHRFQKSQVVMLPTMVYQTRFGTDKCHDYAATYTAQPYNTALWKMPALDGQRDGDALHCIDRTKHQEDDYAILLYCPEGTPESECSDGTVKFSEKHTFHGTTIYPKMLMEPHHDVLQMQAVNWLDVQTDTVTLSTMVYTEGVEVFTSVSVDFSVTQGGNIKASYTLVSYRDMINGSKTTFIVCLVFTFLGALVGVLLTGYKLYENRAECRMGYTMYELFSRTVLLVYPLVLLISWSQQVPMSEEYDQLLHSFLGLEGVGDEHIEHAVQEYFDVKTHIWSETSWLKRHRVVAYVVLYIQFLQLIFYMSAHPKMGVLTATVATALTHIFHFLVIFWVLFLMLGFMAHWMLGPHIAGFATYGGTMETQARMLFGEFLFIDGAGELTFGLAMMYWVYASTFLLVIFFSLLNFFLAIIVDAFCDVKNDIDKQICGGFATDVFRVLYIAWRGRNEQWPPRRDLIRLLRCAVEEGSARHWTESLSKKNGAAPADSAADVKMSCTDLAGALENFGEQKLSSMLSFYYSLSRRVLCERKDAESPMQVSVEQADGAGAPEALGAARGGSGGSPLPGAPSPDPSIEPYNDGARFLPRFPGEPEIEEYWA